MYKVTVIAEAGVNHNGDLSLAIKLIDSAKNAGADFIKFQSFKAIQLVTKSAKQADYQIKNTKQETSQYDMLAKLELSEKDHQYLIEYADKVGIKFLSTPFDLESIYLLQSLGVKIGKVPSGEITNLPYLQNMAKNFESIILSTGMSTIDEVADAIDILVLNGMNRNNITVLHCTTEYPCPEEEVNLKAMITMGNRFKMKFGYSDHTAGILIPIAAVAMGATTIEKHLTLDKNLPGPDHKASLNPDEFYQMVHQIRLIEKALGDGIKKPSKSELKNIPIARKSIVALKAISKGEKLTTENMTTKRPGTGLSPMLWHTLIGTSAIKDFEQDELIRLHD